jgi:hypothetical protein
VKSQTSNYHPDPNKYCEYKTRRLNLAAWIHAENLLEFVRCEYNPRIGKAEFIFADERRCGRDFEDSFDNGASATSAARLFNSLHEMRRVLSSNNKPANGANHAIESHPANR